MYIHFIFFLLYSHYLFPFFSLFFFFNDTATTEIYTLSLHDALPIWSFSHRTTSRIFRSLITASLPAARFAAPRCASSCSKARSEEHTSELQSRQYLVCRLLLEKKKKKTKEQKKQL